MGLDLLSECSLILIMLVTKLQGDPELVSWSVAVVLLGTGVQRSKQELKQVPLVALNQLMAMKQGCECVHGLHHKLRMMGIPVDQPAHICADLFLSIQVILNQT